MDKGKKNNTSSSTADPVINDNIHRAPNLVREQETSDGYWDKNMYDGLHFGSMCDLCIRWNGHSCSLEPGNCNYEPLKTLQKKFNYDTLCHG